jgi:Na+-transporting methylmalonyl-CoA/oxaloacetate decarboxylase gamma subunit
MKTAIIVLLLVISAFAVGCTSQQGTSAFDEKISSEQMTEEQAAQQADASLVDETSEVAIGEMI